MMNNIIDVNFLMEDATVTITKTQKEINKEKALKKAEELKHLEGLKIEIASEWLWVSGEKTKEHKEELKKAGLKYASKKQMWYYNPGTLYRRYGKYTESMDRIREKYDAEIIE